MLNQTALRRAQAILPLPDEEIAWEDKVLMDVVVQAASKCQPAKTFDALQLGFWPNHFGGFSRKALVATSEALGLSIRRHGRWASNNELLEEIVKYFRQLTERAAFPLLEVKF